ncbi:MAG: hypothetical protein D6768_12155, partial [Chloroflexi bacterium]
MILPVIRPDANIEPTVNSLRDQPVDFELLLVGPDSVAPAAPNIDAPLKRVPAANACRGSVLNTGAAAASGQILLFLWPENRLPVEGLLTIERNFALLPQTIGGNFHVKFDGGGFVAERAAHFIKKQRYAGVYFGSSGIFVRKDVFHALDGFRPVNFLEDYEFSRRLEAHGPTLYLPDKIIVAADSYYQNRMGTILKWTKAVAMLQLGMDF